MDISLNLYSNCTDFFKQLASDKTRRERKIAERKSDLYGGTEN